MTERIWLMLFFLLFFFHFVRREGDRRGGQAEQPDRLVLEMGYGKEGGTLNSFYSYPY